MSSTQSDRYNSGHVSAPPGVHITGCAVWCSVPCSPLSENCASTGKSAEKSAKKGGRKSEAPEAPPAKLLKAEWPVVDWRCFDQRNQGFYTWLEPPMQDDDIKCVKCGLELVRVHRCALSCLLCAAAHNMQGC